MSDISKLKDEFDYYIANKDSFVNKYEGRFISLKDHKVICEASTREEAIIQTMKSGYQLGSFLVQHVSQSDDESIQRFHSRVRA